MTIRRLGPVTVVLADDSPIYRRGLVRVMESRPDIELVASVGDGGAAVEAVRQLRPRVVVLDLLMPVLDGIAAWRALAAELELETIPTRALLLSAGLDPDITSRARAAGIERCLAKAESRSTICDAVVALGGGRPMLLPATG